MSAGPLRELGQYFTSTATRQIEVEQDDVRIGLLENVEHFFHGVRHARDLHPRMRTLHELFQAPQHGLVIVDQEDPDCRGCSLWRHGFSSAGHGIRTLTVVPAAVISTSTEPPRSAARSVSECGSNATGPNPSDNDSFTTSSTTSSP